MTTYQPPFTLTDCAPFVRFMPTCLYQALQDITPQVTPQVKALLAIMTSTMTRQEIQEALGLADRKNIRKLYLLPELKAGLVEMTQPDKPNSRNQGYRLTLQGQQALRHLLTI